MMSRIIIFVLVFGVIGGCGRHGQERLTIVLSGRGAVSCYFGIYKKKLGFQEGLLSDPVFAGRVFGTLAGQSREIVVAPEATANIIADMKAARSLFVKYNVTVVEWQLTTPDGIPKTIVDRVAIDPEPDWLAVWMPPMRFNLPGEVEKSDVKVGTRDLVIIPYGDTGIYCYRGPDIRSGKKYTSDELRRFLSARSVDTNFMVIIRPSATCPYRGTVDMLDMMKLAGVKKYALVDITKAEEEYIRQIAVPGVNHI